MINLPLKQAIQDSGWKQYALAERAGLTESRLSNIIVGRGVATPDEQKQIARALGRSRASLFGEQATV